MVSALASINEVNQRRARLALRWVTVSGFSSRCGTFISVCDWCKPTCSKDVIMSQYSGILVKLAPKRFCYLFQNGRIAMGLPGFRYRLGNV